MPALGDFATVSNNLKSVKKAVVVAIHKFVYGDEGDRDNRKRLRLFDGFDYDEKSTLFKDKFEYVENNLSTGDLVAICNLLGIDYNVDNLFVHIFNNLRKGMMLKSIEAVDDENDDLDDDVHESSHEIHQKSFADEQRLVQTRSETTLNYTKGNCVKNVPDTDNMNIYNDYRMPKDEGNNIKQNLSYSMQQYNAPKFSLHFRDIEESIRTFDGTDKLPVNVWIDEFEETASIMCWDDFQKFIFAKRSLKGLAKLFIAGERGITNWPKLKSALLEEFRLATNSAQVHKMLVDRKKYE